jgi:hypothetical protein
MMASELPLCFYGAIHDALYASNDFDYVIFARDALERRINELEGWQREKELTELRLYRLAASAVPWDSEEEGYTPSGELEFLSEKVVPDDTWATFMAFSKAWSKRASWAKELNKYLPRIYEIDEDDWEPEESEKKHQAESNSELTKGLHADLKTLKSSLDRQRLLLYAVIGLIVWLLLVQH